jgi:16S rRNA C1402 (ribose-2'-O) methylase RsmI
VTVEIGRREIRGEIVLLVSGFAGEPVVSEDVLKAEIEKLVQKGLRIKEIAEIVGERFSHSKREIYRLALEGGKKG